MSPKLILAALVLTLAGPLHAADKNVVKKPVRKQSTATYGPEDLLARTVFQSLLADLALQRGDTELGVSAWADLARRTRDPAVIARATEVAGAQNGVELAPVFGPALGEALTRADVFASGAFALEQGFILTAMILAAAVVAIIEGSFLVAGAWFLAGAAFSFFGLMHGWTWGFADTVLHIGPGAAQDAAVAYVIAAVLCFLAPVLGRRDPAAGH